MTEGEGEEVLVRMRGIVKRFPGVVANDGIGFEARAGEVHAVLGENGAGKTTLMNILYGIYQPDEGEIFIRDREVKIGSPKDAIKQGIGMVHQHSMLIPSHTVAENIVLGSSAGFFFPTRGVAARIEDLSERYGLKVRASDAVWQLSAGERQRVEIVKALYRKAQILILDEPTTMFTPLEAKQLFVALRHMASEGKAVILITHKLDEVMAVSDRVTVLRQGKVVATLKTSETEEGQLAQMMVGREAFFRLEKRPVAKGEPVLMVEGLQALNDRGLLALKDVSFIVRARENLGIAGVAGNGQRELVEVITGLRRATKGKVLLAEEEVTNLSPERILAKGVAHIPEDRLRMGIVSDMSVAENLILTRYRQPPYSRGLWLDHSHIKRHAGRLIADYGIATPSEDTPASSLSGGNIQRLILARELSENPRLIIAAHPTYGLDVSATEQIRQSLLNQREAGSAILLVSEDLEEIMSLSDRVAVMSEGEILGVLEIRPDEIDQLREQIGLMMGGVRIKRSQVDS